MKDPPFWDAKYRTLHGKPVDPRLKFETCIVCGVNRAFVCIHCGMKVCYDCVNTCLDNEVEPRHEDRELFFQRKEDERLMKLYGLFNLD